VAEDLTKLMSSTLNKWIDNGGLRDVAFKETPYGDMMKRANMIDMEDGPKEFKANLRTGQTTNFQYYSGYDTWETKPLKGFTRVGWMSRQAVMPWMISGEEIQYNSAGDSGKKMWDIASEVKSNASQSLREAINLRLINRLDSEIPTDQQDLDSCWLSLEDLIGDEESTLSTVGNSGSATLSRIDDYYVRSIIKRPGFGLPPDPKKETGWTRPTDDNVISGGDYDGWQRLVLEDIVELVFTLDRFYRDGYVALTTQKIIRRMISLIKAELNEVNTNLTGTLVSGHKGVEYMGIPFTWDPSVPEGTIYFVHPKCLRFRAISSRWLKTKDPITPYNQDALYGSIFAWGQQYAVEPRGLAKFEQVAA
jgi:hypothetical protein